MNERRDAALGSAMRVEQLGDGLSQAAGTLHAAVMRAIGKRASLGPAGITQAQAQAMFKLEVALRQQANAPGIAYSFKYFQQVSGDIVLPRGVKPVRVIARMQPEDGALVENSFSWSSLVPAAAPATPAKPHTNG